MREASSTASTPIANAATVLAGADEAQGLKALIVGTLRTLRRYHQSNNLFNDKYDVLLLQPSNRKIRYDLLVASIDELMEPDV